MRIQSTLLLPKNQFLAFALYLCGLISPLTAAAKQTLMVHGNSFSIPQTQQIKFVPLDHIDPKLFAAKSLPRQIDLRDFQSNVKNQGPRGACTYFALAGLVESLLKKSSSQEIDISEEHLAWAAKTKMKMRTMEEDSSVAVNAATLQEFGYMLEQDLPYQQSWFESGMPCSGLKEKTEISADCYSHSGPSLQQTGNVKAAGDFVFKSVDSRSIDVVQSLAQMKSPVTVSILGHQEMWAKSSITGDLSLRKDWRKACQKNRKKCSGHAALITGYDLDKRIFYFKNSWGANWGNQGYGTIPFDYIDQMSKRKLLTGYLMNNN